MQNIILALALVLLTSLASIAQCDKKIKWQAAKAEMIDQSGTVMDTKEGITITSDSKKILFELAAEPDNPLEGVVNETACEWKEAFKNGKTVIKANISGRDGNSSPATITIEGKDGKLTLILDMERMQGRKVRMNLDKYEVTE